MDEEPFKVVNEKDYLLPPNERPNISSSYDPRPNNTVSYFLIKSFLNIVLKTIF